MPASAVGIVTRTKNRPLLLERAIQSVLHQTFTDWHLVIVNDGGDPAEVEKIVAPHARGFGHRLTLCHHTQSLGMEAASNAGITRLDARWIVIHDDDDSWQPQFLEKTTATLRHPPAPSFKGVITHTRRIVENIQNNEVHQIHQHPFNEWLQEVSLERMLAENTFPPISFLFEKMAWETLGPYDASLPVLGDWEFNIRFLLRYDIALVPEMLANYHHRSDPADPVYSNSITFSDSRHRHFDSLLRHRWCQQVLALPANNDGSSDAFPHLGRAAWIARHQLDLSRNLRQLQEKLEILRQDVQKSF